MKKLFSFNAIVTMVLALGIMVTFDSCTEDPCENVTCVNGSTVTVGDLCSCQCDNGWSGADCTDEDKCITENTVCLNGGTCLNGDCTCAAGYEGDSCSIVSREKFLGVGLEVTEICGTSNTAPYFVDILESSTGIEYIRIKNLGNYGCSTGDYYVQATVNGTEVTVTNFTACATIFNATGTITEGSVTVLDLDYTASYDPGSGTVTDTCSMSIAL